MKPILKSLTSMAFTKSKYLSEFEGQSWAVSRHLIKVFCIHDDRNEEHWIKEINNILMRLSELVCTSHVSEEELKRVFVSYDVKIDKPWVVVKNYCLSSKNKKQQAYVYLGGLKACSHIPSILYEFIKDMDGFAGLERLDSFKHVMEDVQGDDFKIVTLQDFIKKRERALK